MKKITFILLFLTLAGCKPQSNLDYLKNDKLDEIHTVQYWHSVHETDIKNWKECVEYCKEHDQKNCEAVLFVYNLVDKQNSYPEIGHSGHHITIPNLNK